MRNCQIYLTMHVTMLQKHYFTANVAVFVNISTHFVEIVKQLHYIRYVSFLFGVEVMHWTVAPEVLGSIS